MSRNTTPSPHIAEPHYGYPPSPLFMANHSFSAHNIYNCQPAVQPPPNQYAANNTLYFPTSLPSDESQSFPLGTTAGTSTSNELVNKLSSGRKSASKWSDDQALVLVQEWKERIDDLESRKSNDTWMKIVDTVNKAGPPKTM